MELGTGTAAFAIAMMSVSIEVPLVVLGSCPIATLCIHINFHSCAAVLLGVEFRSFVWKHYDKLSVLLTSQTNDSQHINAQLEEAVRICFF